MARRHQVGLARLTSMSSTSTVGIKPSTAMKRGSSMFPHRVARWVEKPCIVASGVNQRRNAHEDKTSRQVASALDESQPQREPVDREKKVVKRADMDAKERERQLGEIDITQVVIADASDMCFGFAMFPEHGQLAPRAFERVIKKRPGLETLRNGHAQSRGNIGVSDESMSVHQAECAF